MSEESKMRISLFICLSLVGSQVLSLESRDELFARLEACGEILGPLKRLGCFEQILEKENAAKATQPDKSSDAVLERLKEVSTSKLVESFSREYRKMLQAIEKLDYRFDIEPLINDVFKKKFVFVGFSAWLLLTVLALTSSDMMVRVLKSNWKKLHRLVYLIAIFGSLHFIWLSKTIFFKPLIYSIIILILLSFRIKLKKNA